MITKVMMMVTEIDLLYQHKMIESKYQKIWDWLHFFGFPVQKDGLYNEKRINLSCFIRNFVNIFSLFNYLKYAQ